MSERFFKPVTDQLYDNDPKQYWKPVNFLPSEIREDKGNSIDAYTW